MPWNLFVRRRPSNDRNWVPEYARTASLAWRARRVDIQDVRNITYRTRDDYSPAYYDATYDIDDLRSLDLVVSRWTGAAIAHVFVSFGFRSGQHLAISIETRRVEGQKYSKFGGFMKNYALIYVVADERDLIGVRTDVRRERACLYPVKIPIETTQALLLDYLRRIDQLNRHPEFYHTLLNNCTTNIVRDAKSVSASVHYNWKVLLSGYADRYAYDLGLLDTAVSFEELAARSLICRPENAVIHETFSRDIRT